MRYFITFAYDGTSFHGSQTQPNGNTVQAEMETALATILREAVPLTFAGRTDAGVHAEKMVAHFDWNKEVPANLAGRLNNLLPPSIAVNHIERVTDRLMRVLTQSNGRITIGSPTAKTRSPISITRA